MYLNVLVFAVTGLVFALILLGCGRMLSGGLDSEPARRPFESGRAPRVHAWNRFHVRWLYYTLIFLLFDMEMVYMYPWAVVFMEVGWKAFAEMGIFITILVLGILYTWRERGFEWD
ncbi:MAG: NADH-quinone oxidoreductase subunit A [Candidatus Competibacteraceae bacterium]|nr:NADH-quinone oxidoreductase subunit A [Candidatus Competibacteraceae bacterium]